MSRSSRLSASILGLTGLLTLLIFDGGMTWAQGPSRSGRVATPPASGTAGQITAGVRETVLPNGLKVITKEAHAAPVVSFAVWYRVGSRNERTGTTGSSHLLEHMLFKGTKQRRPGEISRLLFMNGADFNASTFYDWTNYYETLSSDRLELAMQIEADRMVNATLDPKEIATEMTVVRSELEGGENDPGTLLQDSVIAAAFERHPYQWPIIGWRSDVENVPRDVVYQYYRSHYGPNNATVVIVGDFKTADALALVRKHFGPIPRIAKPAPVYTTEPPQRGERRLTIRRPGTLPIVNLAYRAPAAKSPDFYALDVLSTVMSAGRTSRLYQNLVEKQIASSADAAGQSLRDPFLFFFDATAAPGVTAERLEEALQAEVERVRTEPVTDEELARAKNQIEAQFVFQNNSVSEQANQLGYWDMAVDWRYLSTYLDRIRKVTAADVQRVAQKYLVRDSLTAGHFIPTAATEESGAPGEASARVERARPGDRPLPLPAPPKKAFVPQNITRFKLANGISVVVQENRSNPSFAIQGSIPGGRVHEPRDKPGLAGLTAAMLTRGTERYSSVEFARHLESVGATLSASSGSLTTSIDGRALSKDFDRTMDLMAEMLLRPTFPTEDLDRLKTQVLAGLEEEKDSPSDLAARAFARAIYGEANPLRPRTLEEAVSGIRSLTREDLEGFYRRQYGPDRMILVIVGDVRATAVRQALESRLGGWVRNPQAGDVPEIQVTRAARGDRQVIRVPDKSEAVVLWGHAGGLRRKDPEFHAVQVMNLILGGGGALNSRLGTTIRDVQGLVYGVSSGFEADRFAGPFEISMGTNPGNVERAIRALQQEVQRMREKGVTQRELDEAVAYLTGSFPLALETNEGLAGVLWRAEFYGLGPNYIRDYPQRYRAVTLAQVNAAAKKYLHPDAAALVIAGTVAAGTAPKR